MEEFMQIKWSSRRHEHAAEPDKLFDINLSDKKSFHKADPLRCHLLEIHPIFSEIDSDNESANNPGASTTNQISTDPRTGEPAPSAICDFSNESTKTQLALFNQFRNISNFTINEHRLCLNAIDKMYATDLSQADKEAIEYYNAVAELRKEETNTYLNCAKDYYIKHLTERYKIIHPVFEQFVLTKWKLAIINELRRCNDRWYRLQTGLPLNSINSTAVKIHAKRIHIDEEGFVFRKCSPKNNLYTTFESLMNWYDAHQAAKTPKNVETKCQSLADEHDANVVLPLSAICLLMDNDANSTTNWMMECSIDDLPSANIFQRKCRLIIGKPLPPTSMNSVEMHKAANKYLIRSASIPHLDKYQPCKDKVLKDSFEVPATPAKMEINGTNTADYKCHPFEDYLKQKFDKNKDWLVPKGNRMYSIWEWAESNSEQPSNDKLTVLITHKQDAYQEMTPKTWEYVNFSSKVEFKAEFGAEQMTKSELLREWCRHYFRGNSITQRVRIHMESQRVLSKKQLKLDDIERDLQRLYQINPYELLCNVWNIFRLVLKFPQGKYLLRHDQKHNQKIMVFAEAKDSSSNGLHLPTIYSTVDIKRDWKENLDWIPIDDGEATILHKMAQVAPCAFSSHRILGGNSQKKGKGHTKGKNSNYVNPKDDRQRLLDRIESQKKLKHEQEKSRENARKKMQRKRKNGKDKLVKMNKIISEADTLDPYVMFDPSGNVCISGLVASGIGNFSDSIYSRGEPIASTSTLLTSAEPSADKIGLVENTAPSPNKQPADSPAAEIICDKLNTLSVEICSSLPEVFSVVHPESNSNSALTANKEQQIETNFELENQIQIDFSETDVSSTPKIESDNKFDNSTDIFSQDFKLKLDDENSQLLTRKKPSIQSNNASAPNQTVTRSGRIVKPKRK